MEKGISILLFSSEPLIAGMICDFLKKESHRYLIKTVTYDKDFNLEYIHENCDIILICCAYPSLTELSIIHSVRSDYPFIPVIIVANDCPADFVAEALKRGVIDFYYLPANDIPMLHDKIESALLLKKKISHCNETFSELQRKENELKGILENIQDAYFRADVNGNLEIVNQVAVSMFGYSSINEMIGMHVSGLYSNVLDRNMVRDSVRSNHFINDFVAKALRKDQTEFWGSLNGKECYDDKGAYIGSEGIIRDISERMKNQDELNLKAQLLDNSFDSIIVFDSLGYIQYSNENACKIRGYTRDELLNMNIIELIVPDFIRKFESALGELKHNDEVLFELSHIRKDRSVFYVEVKLRKISFEGKDLILHSSVDISDKLKAVDALSDSETRYRDLTESSPIGILTTDLEGVIVYENTALKKIIGMPEGEVSRAIGTNLTELPNIKDTKLADLFCNVSKGIPIKDLEIPFESIYGNLSFLRVNGIPIRNNHGKINGNLLIIQDITERRKTEEALMQERKLLRTLIENLPSAVFAKDKDYRKVIVNNNHIESVLGHLKQLGENSEIDILGKTDFEVFPRELAEMFFEDDQKVVRDGVSIINNLEFGFSRDGEKIWNLVSKIPLRDVNGEIIGMVGITTDITELKKTEQELYDQKEKLEMQNEKYASLNDEYKKLNVELRKSNEELLSARIKAEESDRLKTAFLQNMSHEIRTPMNAIMGFSELLPLEFDDKERLEKYAGIIYQRSSDLLDIINGILDISKIESGQLPVHFESFDLTPVFSELDIMFQEYRKRINKEFIHFSISVTCDKKMMELTSDKVKLKQIFINLIGNAFKFTVKGKIEAGCMTDVDGGLVFFVSDTGIGIAKEKHALIFERFMQVNDKIASVSGGTGLGLSIVQGLLKLLGGKIWLESEPGVGSTFFFTLSNGEIPKMESVE